MKFNDKDLYEAKIDEFNDGIIAISLVEYPAVEKNFVCFKANQKPVRYSIDNEEERLVTGVVMLADSPIYRRDGDYEYYITYSKETIKKMAAKMLDEGTFKNNDVQHNGEFIKGMQLTELYIKDSAKGIVPSFIDDIPDGSLLASFYVYDDALWDEVKNGNYLNGFSLEGLFTVQKMNNNKKRNTNMNILNKFMKRLVKLAEIVTDKGTLLIQEGDEIAVGTEVFIEQDGEWVAAADGEYVYGEKTIVIEDGKISAIKEEEVEEPESVVEDFQSKKQKFEESYDDKTRKIAEAIHLMGFEGWVVEAGDDFAVLEVWVEETEDYKDYRFVISWDEEGNPVVGDHEEVKEAFVPVEEEEKPAEEPVEFEEEKPVEEPVIEEPVEPQPEERDEKQEQIDALKEEVAGLKEEISKLQEALNEIVIKPVVEPIVEEFEKATEVKTKGNKAAALLSHLNK